jgi:membrane protease YdiL (CAAX protease family)
MFKGVLSVVLGTLASVLALFVVFQLPTIALLRVAHRIPAWLEPRLALVVAQSLILLLLYAALRPMRRSVAPGRPTLTDFRAVGWMTATTFLLSLLVAVTMAAGESRVATTGLAAPLVEQWTREFPISGMWGRVALAAVLAPMVEEFFFRGLLIGHLMRNAPGWFAVAVSSILFALGHDSAVFSALFALGAGLLYLRYRSVWLCVVAHSANNLLAAMGGPLLAAQLADHGVTMNLGYWTLPVQLVWFAAVLACAAMFLRRVFGRIGGQPTLLLRRPVDPVGRAPT